LAEDKICATPSYKYFDRYRSYMGKVMNQHEIDKAIRSVIGVRQFDKRIRKIWNGVLKEKADV
jgi:hypothetical protein